MHKRIVVKIGSNVLTKQDGTLDLDRLNALVNQVALLHQKGIEVIMVSSGAVAAGKGELQMVKKLDSVSSRQLFSSVGQAKLINHYYDMFSSHGIFCGQVLTTKENFRTRNHYLTQLNCIQVMLESGVVPIINENDTISVSELMFTDNDELSGLIATMMQAEALIILSNIDGIYNGDPKDATSQVIRHIPLEANISKFIQSTKSSLGRGGMGTKYNIAKKAAKDGIEVIIANGKRENILIDLIEGNEVPHTVFSADTKQITGQKRQLSYSQSFTKGKVYVNAKAAEKLKMGHAVSLLFIGVTKIEGDFKKNDVVSIFDANGEEFCVGKAMFDSDKAQTLLGSKGQKPLIHCDYMYFLDDSK